MSTLPTNRLLDAVRFPSDRESLEPAASARNSRAMRRVVAAAVRCLGVATLACVLTRPLFHVPRLNLPSQRSEAPVSVTADISRRLSASDAEMKNNPEDRMHWVGMSER